MNSWYVSVAEFEVFFVLSIVFLVLMIKIIRAKKSHRKIIGKVLLLVCDVAAFAGVMVYSLSHATYYKYNDWVMLKSNVSKVVDKYGTPDLGSVKKGEKGKIAYYIYKDDGPVMPDHMEHFYFIHYDEDGNIYRVEDSVKPGG